jgi:hypothetical protein
MLDWTGSHLCNTMEFIRRRWLLLVLPEVLIIFRDFARVPKVELSAVTDDLIDCIFLLFDNFTVLLKWCLY